MHSSLATFKCWLIIIFLHQTLFFLKVLVFHRMLIMTFHIHKCLVWMTWLQSSCSLTWFARRVQEKISMTFCDIYKITLQIFCHGFFLWELFNFVWGFTLQVLILDKESNLIHKFTHYNSFHQNCIYHVQPNTV